MRPAVACPSFASSPPTPLTTKNQNQTCSRRLPANCDMLAGSCVMRTRTGRGRVVVENQVDQRCASGRSGGGLCHVILARGDVRIGRVSGWSAAFRFRKSEVESDEHCTATKATKRSKQLKLYAQDKGQSCFFICIDTYRGGFTLARIHKYHKHNPTLPCSPVKSRGHHTPPRHVSGVRRRSPSLATICSRRFSVTAPHTHSSPL